MSELLTSIMELDAEAVLSTVQKEIDEGRPTREIIERLREGMTEVGKRFERREYFLTDLMMAASIFTSAMELIRPTLQSVKGSTGGLVLIGTPSGDIHDIGKNIVNALLQAEGIEIIDLGVDVPPKRFVEIVEEKKPKILGLSLLVTPSIYSAQEVVEVIAASGLRENLVIVLGGGAVDEKVVEFVGADHYAPDAFSGVRLMKRILKEK